MMLACRGDTIELKWLATVMCGGLFLFISVFWLNLALAFGFSMLMLSMFMLEEKLKKECELK